MSTTDRMSPTTGYEPAPCKATSKATGKPCGRTAVPGATVCTYHGGNAPQVKRKAALRLLELVDPAITTLAREMVQADKSGDRQRAANSILDRAGVPRSMEVADSEASKMLLVQRLLALREARETAAAEENAIRVIEAVPAENDDVPTTTDPRGEDPSA